MAAVDGQIRVPVLEKRSKSSFNILKLCHSLQLLISRTIKNQLPDPLVSGGDVDLMRSSARRPSSRRCCTSSACDALSMTLVRLCLDSRSGDRLVAPAACKMNGEVPAKACIQATAET